MQPKWTLPHVRRLRWRRKTDKTDRGNPLQPERYRREFEVSPNMGGFPQNNGVKHGEVNMYFILFDAPQSRLHFIRGSFWYPWQNMDVRVDKPPKMLKMECFSQKCLRKWRVPESWLRVLSRTPNFASTEIWFVEIYPAIRTGSGFLSWKISRFHFLPEIALEIAYMGKFWKYFFNFGVSQLRNPL